MRGQDGGGGGRVCGLMCSPSAPSAVSSSAFSCLSLCACSLFFWGGEGACGWAFLVLGVGVAACRCRCWLGCGCRGRSVAVALRVPRVCVGPQAYRQIPIADSMYAMLAHPPLILLGPTEQDGPAIVFN